MAGDDRIDAGSGLPDPFDDDDAFGSGLRDEPRLAGTEPADTLPRPDDDADDLATFGGGSVSKGLVSPKTIAKPRFVDTSSDVKAEMKGVQPAIGMKEPDGGSAPDGNEQRPTSSSVDGGNDDSDNDGNASTDPGSEEQSLIDPVDPFLDDDLRRHGDTLDSGIDSGVEAWAVDDPVDDAFGADDVVD